MTVHDTEGQALDRLRDALDAAGSTTREKTTGAGFQAQCPAHHDRHPSLSVTGIDGQALVHCHGGCDTEVVLDVLGLKLADLYDQPQGAEYRYPDGRVVHRSPNKRFRQSGTTSGHALYRSDQLAEASTVYVVEGEKDVHALEAVGASAVCNPMGAGKAGKADWSPLAGKHAVIVADQDQAGTKHAHQVATLLAEHAAATVLAAPAAGKDAADHVAAGYGLDELQLLQQTHTTGPELVTLADVEPERIEWLWPARLPAGKLVLLDGDPSLGKSTLSLDLAAHVSTGTPWPDGSTCPAGDVVLLSAEDGMADTIRPRLDAAGADANRVHAFTSITERDEDGVLRSRPPTLLDSTHLHQVVHERQARLLIIDVLMAYLPSKVDSHRDQDVRGVLHHIATMADETGCTVLLLRHLNKTSGGNAIYRGGGSIGIVGAARAGFLVAPDPDDESGATLVLASVKSNLAPTPPSLNYRLADTPESHVAHVAWSGESAHAAGELLAAPNSEERSERDEAVEWLKSYLVDHGGTAKAGEVIKAASKDGVAKTTLTRARQRAGVTSVKDGMRGGWVWSLEPGPRRVHEESEGSSSHTPDSSDSSVDSSTRPGHPEGSTQGAKSAGTQTPLPSHPSGASPSAEADRPRPLAGTPPPTYRCSECGMGLSTPTSRDDGSVYCRECTESSTTDTSAACHTCGGPLGPGYNPDTNIPYCSPACFHTGKKAG